MFPPSLTTMLPKFGWVISSVLFVLIVVYGFYIRDMWTVRAHNLWQLQCNQKAFIPCPTCSFFKVDNKGVIQSINLNLWDTAGQVPPDPPIKLILCDSLSKVHPDHLMFKRVGTRFDNSWTTFIQEEYDTLRPLSYPGAVRPIQGGKSLLNDVFP